MDPEAAPRQGHTRPSQEAIVDTILRRMPDYVKYICPQFSETHVNFQRVPTVDTSNPFISRDIPSADESMLVIRFRSPKDIDFPYLLSMLHDGFMSRANTIVVPRRQNGLGDATHLHANDLATDGSQEKRVLNRTTSMTAMRANEERPGHSHAGECIAHAGDRRC